jgi:hypothetical protein
MLMDWRTESCRQTQHGKMRENAHLPYPSQKLGPSWRFLTNSDNLERSRSTPQEKPAGVNRRALIALINQTQAHNAETHRG